MSIAQETEFAAARHSRLATGVELPLTPQHRYFLRCFHPVTNCTSRVVAINVEVETALSEIARAVDVLVRRFEALRTRFVQQGGKWRATLYPATTFDRLEVHQSISATPAEHEFACSIVAGQLWYAIQPADEWLFRVAVCRAAAGMQTVIFALHTLAADLSSVGSLVETFQRALRLRGQPGEIGAPVSTYSDYCIAVAKADAQYVVRTALDPLAGLMLDPQKLRLNAFASIRERSLLLVPTGDVPRLGVAARGLHAPLPTLLMAIAILAAMRWMRTTRLNPQLTYHGRLLSVERAGLDIDVGTEVGPFAAVICAPVALTCEDSSTHAALRATLEALRDAFKRWHEYAHIDVNTGNVDVDGYRPMGLALNYVYAPPVPTEAGLRTVEFPGMRTFAGALRGTVLSISIQHAADIRVALRYSEALYPANNIDAFESCFAAVYAGSVADG